MRFAGLTLVAAILLTHLGCATVPQSATLSDDEARAIATTGSRTLTWQHYDGTGDHRRAVYYLGDRELGRGEAGLSSFLRVIEHAPPGTQYRIGHYYSPFTRPQRTYPMDQHEIWNEVMAEAIEREIAITYPTLLNLPR